MSTKKKMYCCTMVAIAVLFTSCASNTVFRSHKPAPYLANGPPPITIESIKLKGDKGENFEIIFNEKDGRCKEVNITYDRNPENTSNFNCESKEISTKLSNTYFCVPLKISGKKDANASINGVEGPMYCGNIHFLTEGTDIQFKSNVAPTNRKCREIQGRIVCY